MRTRKRQTRVRLASLKIARHGAVDAVVVERETLRVGREAANGVAQGIATVVVAKLAISLPVCRDEPGDVVTL